MTRICRHCGYEHILKGGLLPPACRSCGCTDWAEYWATETSSDLIFRLKIAVRHILKSNQFAGIGRDPDGHYIVLIPYMCDRWLMNPALYGDFQGTVNDPEQIEPMLLGEKGKDAIHLRARTSAYQLGK